MPSVTARQVRKHKEKEGGTIDLQERIEEAGDNKREFDKALDIWTVGFFDIETTDLKGNFGHIISADIYSQTGKHHTFRFDDELKYPGWKDAMWDESRMARDISEAMAQFDILVTYNGQWFDFPFTDTRLIKYDFPVTPKVFHIDLYWWAKRKLSLHSYKLESVAQHLGVPAKLTPLNTDIWHKAQYGDKESVDYVVMHNMEDTETTAGVFQKLKGFIDVVWRKR